MNTKIREKWLRMKAFKGVLGLLWGIILSPIVFMICFIAFPIEVSRDCYKKDSWPWREYPINWRNLSEVFK